MLPVPSNAVALFTRPACRNAARLGVSCKNAVALLSVLLLLVVMLAILMLFVSVPNCPVLSV